MLTLTASPIPRTLEMSLTGVRDLSLIATPPSARRPILTYVGEYDERAVAEAIRRELLREGQVFFVHHRVRDIEKVAARLRELVPEARVAIANGQMDEGSLERVVLDFWEGRYDVLVCTTIIESGIDMPTVNTLVIDRADMLGLGQLHQLRGRVGRAGQRAYAYLFYPQNHKLTEEAYERLRTIGEHTELGSGFKIAMRDLEIRGAGNLLGADQSGHIAAVGYDLYVQMVSEAVADMKGEPVRQPAEIRLDLPMTANLPASYVAREDLRLEAYRKLATLSSHEEVDDVESEWTDRYGPLPKAGFSVAGHRPSEGRVRAAGDREDITVVSGGIGTPSGSLVARVSPVSLKASEQVRLGRVWPRAVYKEDQGQLVGPSGKVRTRPRALVETCRALVPPAESVAVSQAVRPGANIGPAVKPPVLARRSRRHLAATWRRASWRARTTPLAVVAVAGVLGSGLSACSTSPPAAMVNGEVITQTELSQNLQAWSSSPAYVASFDQASKAQAAQYAAQGETVPRLYRGRHRVRAGQLRFTVDHREADCSRQRLGCSSVPGQARGGAFVPRALCRVGQRGGIDPSSVGAAHRHNCGRRRPTRGRSWPWCSRRRPT